MNFIHHKLGAFFNPERFQGWGKQRSYFEGWYFKVLNTDASKAYAFIPGIAMDEQGKRHAFIQVLDGKKKTAAYHRYPFDAFIPAPDRFHVTLGEGNSFSAQHVNMDVGNLSASLQFSGNIPWPKPFYAPGIMGPFSFVPFMECYHGIVSMDHHITGTITDQGEVIDMNGGRGYLEKDWGRSFPSAYIWMQGNHFSRPGISLKTSVARVPWMGYAFTGFISGLWLDDRLIRFTTYNGTRLRKCMANQEEVSIVLENRKYRLELLVKRDQATGLSSPIRGLMEGRIEESMGSVLHLQLSATLTGKLIHQDICPYAALEVAGDIQLICTN